MNDHINTPVNVPPSSPLIEASSLIFRHEGAERDTLRDLSFSIERGSLYGLLGVNGSGKSTLLAVLAGLFPITSGKAHVAGCELPRESFRLRGKVALVPQSPDSYILGSLAREDLLLGIAPGDEEAKRRALNYARDFELEDLLDNPVHTLSYGQRRKLCLASALAAQPELLLLDEPFAGLDYPAALSMRGILRKNRASGLTQVVVGHDLDLMADITDSFILMREGRIIQSGRPVDVFPHLLAAGVRPPCAWMHGKDCAPEWLKISK